MKENKKLDSEVFVPKEKVITIDGTDIAIPKLPWKKEIQLLRKISDMLVDLNKLGIIKKGVELTVESIIGMVPKMIDKIEGVTDLVAIILDKEKGWIEDNLDMESVADVIIPFFVKLKSMGGKFQAIQK